MLSYPSLWKPADHCEVSLLYQVAFKAKLSMMWVIFHPELTPYQSNLLLRYYLSSKMKRKERQLVGALHSGVLPHYDTEILLGLYPHLTSS